MLISQELYTIETKFKREYKDEMWFYNTAKAHTNNSLRLMSIIGLFRRVMPN